ncbi:MAG: hypothetical protein N4A35_03855 [Flavobacteriales bacterium]|jgi:hypothetical protein|nr:hypothetical protein [Flavobacteriales bacterium]
MKIIVTTLLFTLSIMSFNAQSLTEETHQAIHTFLSEFKVLAKASQRAQLLEMVEPYEIESKKVNEFIVDQAIAGEQSLTKNFSYSDQAMQILLDDLVVEFEPLSEKVREILNHNDEFHKIIHQLPNDKVAMLNHNKVRVLLTLKDSGIKLLFWENMNNLIQ